MTDTALQRNPSGMELLDRLSRQVTDPAAAVEIAKQIVALQVQQEQLRQSQETFEWQKQDRQSRIEFDEALARCQAAIPQIKPDAFNNSTRSWWQRYETLDRTVRPIYTSEGFSISFGERDSPTPEKVRVVAYVSRGGVTREYIKDVTPPLLGPKGNAVMTATHGDASANSYGKRYLLIDIFNIAKAIGEVDTDGNPLPPMNEDTLTTFLNRIKKATVLADAKSAWHEGARVARDARDDLAKGRLMTAYEEAQQRINASQEAK